MNLKSVWSALEESSEILFGNYAYPAADKAAEELSLPDNFYNWVQAIWLFDTNLFTIAQLMRCFPYGLAQANDERLTAAVQQGYLVSDGQGKYRATESVRTAAFRLIKEGNELMAGLAYGVEALFNLMRKDSDGVVRITRANVHDWPSILWRGRPHSVMAQQLLPGQLDAYVHARLNYIDYRDNPEQKESATMPSRKSSMGCPPGQPVDEQLCRKVLDTYHHAGFYVYGVVSCALPEGDYSKLAQTFDELLKLGCDGIWVSMDDTGGGSDPVRLAEYAAQYMRRSGKTGHDACFTPGPAEYTTIDKPLNRAMAKIATFNEAVWIFTRVPCQADYELCRQIGLKGKPAWWFNYCETEYPDPKAGFIHSSAILTSQRKDGGVSYMNLLPITPGWGYPEFDKIRDAAKHTDQVNLWALCGGWPAEYALVMFGHWAWNPAECNWPVLRDSIYDFVWGPSQVPVIRELDERLVQLKELYWLPDRGGFRTPDKGLVRLKIRADRPKALGLLDKLDKLAATLAETSFDETALTANRLRDFYLDPLQVSLRFARKQATLEYPEYEFADFEMKASELLAKTGEEAANAYLADARAKILPMLDALAKELAELKDIEPVLSSWRQRLDRAKTVGTMQRAQIREREAAWKNLVSLPVKEFLPFLEHPAEADLMGILRGIEVREEGSQAVGTSSANAWTTAVHQTRGGYRTGLFTREGIEMAAIVLPRKTKSQPGDFGCVEQTIRTPQVQPGKKLTGKLFIADTRIDNAYRNVRFIEVVVNGKQIFRRDVSDPQAKDWVVFDLTGLAGAESLTIQVRVVEARGVADHTSWVFVGPLTLAVE